MTDDKDKQKHESQADQPETAQAEPRLESQEEANPPGEDSEAAQTGVARKRTGWVWALVLIVLVIAAGEGAFIWWYDQQMRQSVQQMRSEMQSELERFGDTQQDQRRQMQSDLQQLRQSDQQLKTNLKDLLERNQHLRKDWLLLEAEYLVKLANHRLLLEEDINTAVVALEAADKRLKQTGDPGVIKIRERIARDIQALRSVPQADVTGLSLKLSALYEAVDNLPLATPDPRRLQEAKQQLSLDTEQIEKWSELPAVIWDDLKSLIVIRQHDKAIEPLLSPEQRFFLIENIRLQLEQARLALLADEPAVYFQRLEKARDWMERYFDKDAAAVSNALETIAQLRDVTLDPELPDLAGTYQALDQYQQKAVQDGEPEAGSTSDTQAAPGEQQSNGTSGS